MTGQGENEKMEIRETAESINMIGNWLGKRDVKELTRKALKESMDLSGLMPWCCQEIYHIRRCRTCDRNIPSEDACGLS